MKVKKKWKRCMHQIALACLLICCIATYVPYKVYAFNFTGTSGCLTWKYTENYDGGYSDVKMTFSKPVYIFKVVGHYPSGESYTTFYFISKQTFTCTVARENHNDDGSTKETTSTLATQGMDARPGWSGTLGYASIMQNNNMHDISGYFDCDGDNLPKRYNVTAGIIAYLGDYIYTLLSDEDASNITGYVIGDDSEGGVNNPILDSDIGCPIITRKISRDLSGVDSGNSGVGGSLHVGETQVGDNIYYDNGGLENGGNGFYTSFTWKNSTTTGFSLNKNKYAQTFLQVRIQNRSVIYSNLKHTKVKRKLDSYGENSLVYDSWAVSKKPLYFNLSSESFLKKYLPKYYEEINSPVNLTNTLFLGNKYAFQFRIICTDDLSVIPGSGGNSKWHCGRWTEVTVNCDVLEDDDPYQKTGDIDSDGDFVQKEDDTTTKIDDSSSGQADNMDDFKDSAENGTKKRLDTSGFGWDDFKNLINECKQVPDLIKSVFSFLPDWVLVFIAIGFGIWIFVLIKRAIV